MASSLARRVINGHMNYGGLNNLYIANNTSKNTYPTFVNDDFNKGELILFHVGGGYVKQALSHSGLTTTVRTDDLIDGVPYTPMPYMPVVTGLLGSVVGWKVRIVGGTGIGQMRSIVANSTSSLTVDAPWRVAPDSTSKLVVDPGYNNNIIYNNAFTGAPPGFVPPGDSITGIKYGTVRRKLLEQRRGGEHCATRGNRRGSNGELRHAVILERVPGQHRHFPELGYHHELLRIWAGMRSSQPMGRVRHWLEMRSATVRSQ